MLGEVIYYLVIRAEQEIVFLVSTFVQCGIYLVIWCFERYFKRPYIAGLGNVFTVFSYTSDLLCVVIILKPINILDIFTGTSCPYIYATGSSFLRANNHALQYRPIVNMLDV